MSTTPRLLWMMIAALTYPGLLPSNRRDTRSDTDGDAIDDNGDGIPDCDQFEPTPTDSTWGLVVLTLLLAIALKLAVRTFAPSRSRLGKECNAMFETALDRNPSSVGSDVRTT